MAGRIGPLQTALVLLALVVCVVVPFYFWQGTWFGRPLQDEELTQFLTDPDKSRRVQHGLSQIAARMERGDPKVAQWYETVAQLSEHSGPQVRVTAAWVMGQDSTSELFHNTLLQMLSDDEVLVRRNAALSLVRFGDDEGLSELRAMLAPDSEPEHVWESLRALALIGGTAELDLVDAVSENPLFDDDLRRQATLTYQAIESRIQEARSDPLTP
ncbi:MAG: HEAT repeat domain-containing protein [Acidobacteriota bacterium]